MEKDIIKKCLDYIILLAELNEVQRLKHCAIKEQSFELAVKLRDEERELQSKIPTLEEIKNLRSVLNGS